MVSRVIEGRRREDRPPLGRILRYRGRLLRGRLNRLMGHVPRELDLQSFELMRRDNEDAPAVYRASRFWGRINDRFRDLMWADGLVNVRNEYFNRAFAGPDPHSRQVYRALLFLYCRFVREKDVDGFLSREAEPAAGGALDQEIFDGRALSLDFLQSVEEAYCLREAWRLAGRAGHPQVVVELGAGYGRLAYVWRRMMPECTYVIIDLPEALACAASYLGRVLPGEAVPYVRSREIPSFSRALLGSGRVWLLGAHQIRGIADGAVDAFVNVYSFAEMRKEAIRNYFQQIDRITRGVLYTKQRLMERNIEDGIIVGPADYPYPEGWRLLFSRTTSLYDSFIEGAYEVRSEEGA